MRYLLVALMLATIITALIGRYRRPGRHAPGARYMSITWPRLQVSLAAQRAAEYEQF